ncbi:MAG: hypothetical protein LBQ50_06720 [Planctomycetaceae bacterium]|jgi:hypothetical protein|nr:hypothetical protein [Planctomycetaceae bacterium]
MTNEQEGKTNVDMTYRFTWDTEPTEEQLDQLMKEVAEKVRQQSVRQEQLIRDRLKQELELARTFYQQNDPK